MTIILKYVRSFFKQLWFSANITQTAGVYVWDYFQPWTNTLTEDIPQHSGVCNYGDYGYGFIVLFLLLLSFKILVFCQEIFPILKF